MFSFKNYSMGRDPIPERYMSGYIRKDVEDSIIGVRSFESKSLRETNLSVLTIYSPNPNLRSGQKRLLKSHHLTNLKNPLFIGLYST